jgi:hypothetical protein
MSRVDDIVVAIAPIFVEAYIRVRFFKEHIADANVDLEHIVDHIVDAIVHLAQAIDMRLADTELADAKSVPICPHAPHTFWTIPESVAIWYNAETHQCRHCGVKIQHVE